MDPAATGSPRTRAFPVEAAVFLTVVVLQALPVLLFPYFPNWDGPAHVGAASVIATRNDPARSEFREYFVVSFFPNPNWSGHLALVFLTKVLPGALAERVLVLLIFLAFPLSVRYALAAVSPRSAPLAYLALPLGLNLLVHGGAYNFCLGLPIFFATLGFWLRRQDRPGPAGVAALSILLVLAYLSHIVPYVMLLMFLGVSALWASRSEARAAGAGFLRVAWDRSKLPALACLPSLALAAVYFLRGGDGGPTRRIPLPLLVKDLVTLAPAMVTFRNPEKFVGLLLGLSILSLTAWGLLGRRGSSSREPRGVFLVLAAASVALYFLAPDAMGGGSALSRRLSLFPYFSLLLWCAGLELRPTLRAVLPAVGLAASLALIVLRFPAYVEFNRDLEEFASAGPHLRANSTILPLKFIREDNKDAGTAWSCVVRPLDYASGYLMADRGVVDLTLYEAPFRYFPVSYRADRDPCTFIGSAPDWMEQVPPRADFASYSRRTPGRVDYVLVWGLKAASQDVLEDPATVSIRAQLDADYRRIFTSPQRGLLELYERRR
ncbi:MAG TPA: hypothetical protein VNM14_19760 [Planctomycetota bacterium]|nr:hypothetical protein [Planctomycetota bacterium]